jgi:hypothetical protein
MAYIGKTPTAAPLTSSDIAADIINSTHIGDTAISGFDALATEPADTDEFLISDGGVLKRLDASLVGGGGITEADQWRLTANKTDSSDITANLERNDSTGFSYIGTGMTESSGIFSFPSTGIYLVETTGSFEAIPDDSVNLIINVTTDNGSYTEVAKGLTAGDGSSTGFGSSTTSFYFDVTNVSTHKVKFSTSSISSGTSLMGNSTMNFTYFNFIRLGDT